MGFGRRRGGPRHRRHVIAAIGGGLGLLVVLALFGLPLALRGPVLRALARHHSKNLCGTVEVAGGHLGANVVLALIRQRPFDVALDGLRIREPESGDLFRAQTVRLRLAVLRKPWRVVVENARVADGAWKLVNHGEGQLLTAALEPLPAAGRSACRVPPSTPGKPPPLGSLVRVEAVTVQDMTLVLSFPAWALTLEAIDVQGTMEVRGTPDGVQLLFDARDVRTRKHGSLRVGPAGPRTLEVPFDSVDIPRAAVTDAAPYDLRLSVAAARTRGARLTGEATFTDVFAPHSAGRSAGMILSARWTELGQALARDPALASVGRGLAALHAGARTSLRGPFDALTGSATIDGKGLSLRARLLPHERYALDADFRALDTRPLLARDRRATLAGRLDGHLAVSARLGPGPQDRSVTLDDIALALQRDPPAGDALPRRWVIDRTPAPRSSPAFASSASDLHVTLGDIALKGDEIVVDRFRVQAPGVSVAGDLHGNASGPRARGRFASSSIVTWRGETFRMPPRLEVDSNAKHDLTIAPFRIANTAGGTIGLEGSIRHDGAVDLRATVVRYPLAHLPGVARAHVPGQNVPLCRLLGGELDADLRVGGTTRSPSLAGQLAFNDLRWDRQPIGDGVIRFDAVDGGTRFAGRLMSGVDLNGRISQRHGASLHARLALAQLQRALPALRVRRATGTIAADADVPAGGANTVARANARVSWTEPLSIWPARLPVAIEIQPARLALDDDQLTLSRLVARAAGVQATLAGSMRIDRTDTGASAIEATLAVAADGRQLGAALGGASHLTGGGTADMGATLSGSLRALRLHGQARFQALTVDWPGSPVGAVRLDGPLVIDGPLGGTAAGPQLVIGPLLARLASGGWILVAGAHRPGPGRPRAGPIAATDRGDRSTRARVGPDDPPCDRRHQPARPGAGAGAATARSAGADVAAHRVGQRRLHLLSPGARPPGRQQVEVAAEVTSRAPPERARPHLGRQRPGRRSARRGQGQGILRAGGDGRPALHAQRPTRGAARRRPGQGRGGLLEVRADGRGLVLFAQSARVRLRTALTARALPFTPIPRRPATGLESAPSWLVRAGFSRGIAGCAGSRSAGSAR